jgi:ATP-dependent Clp protease ATP-binding subunit ClpA
MITANFLIYDFLEDTKDQTPQDYLSQYGTNFTELSKRGLLEQCFSRENDLYQIMEILLRKQKNNPVLVGEPGVGKTALVELFAERIANNDVPFIFQGCDILGIDIAKMLAGAKYRGEFELRLIQLLEQIIEENGVIVFFDEIHILKTSGTAEGALDAGNLLKPILSRPGSRCLGATTPKEYKKIEEDAALTRRFHPIIITESSKADTFEILNGLRATLEIYHNVYYTDLALIEAVNLSTKYIGDKALPDKAIDLLDRAGAREALYRSDINYASFFNAMLFAGLKKLAILKIKAFRRGDIATQFILSEIQNAYRNLQIRWANNSEVDKFTKKNEKKAKKEAFFQKLDTKIIDDDFDILTVEILPTNESNLSKIFFEKEKAEIVLYEPIFQNSFTNSDFFIRKLEIDKQKISLKKGFQNLFHDQLFFSIQLNFTKKVELNYSNNLFFNEFKHNLNNLNVIKEKEKNNYIFFKQKLLNTLISYSDSFSDFDTRSYHFEENYPSENSIIDNSKNSLTFYNHSKIKKKKVFSDLAKSTLTKIKVYKKSFQTEKKIKVSSEVKSSHLNFLLELRKQKNHLFAKIPNIIESEILLDEIIKQVGIQKYSSADDNTLKLINNSILERVDDLLFSSNKPRFLLDTKEKQKNLSKQKTIENYKNLISEFLNFDEKKDASFKTIKKNTFKINFIEGSSTLSLYRAGLIFLYKEKCDLRNLVSSFDNYIQEFYLIKWNKYYSYFSKYLYSYAKNLTQFNKVFFHDSESNNKNYFINDIVLDFLEVDIEQYISFEQTLDENNKAKINSLTTLFKGLPPLLHKRYIDALNIDPLEDQEKIEIENVQPSTSLLKKEQENELIYNLLGFFSTQKGRNFLSNTNDPELMRIARKIGDYNLAALDYRIGAYEIQRLVTSLTGISVESLTESEMQKLLNLENTLHKRVIGQNEAITALSKAIRRSRLGIQNPSRPIGSFLFCGPTGVGKTELSKALSEAIFGSEKEMIRFDMSEFMERFSVTRLIGSPPGYVGYEEGGQLSDAVRKKPYSLVLFDEIEKAHIEVLNILLQILEDGRLTDSQKRLVLFQNTIIIMTSNAAAKEIQLSLESIEKERKRKNEDKIEAIIEKPISKGLENTKKKSLNSSYLDPRLGRIDLIPTIINTNFVVDIRDNIKQTFSGSYTGQLFVNKLYKKFPELNDLNIAKGNDKSVTLSTKKNTLFNKKNNQINTDEKIKGLQKKIAQKDVDQTDIKELVMNKLTKFFLPEFINRLDDIIIFESLTYEDILEIYDIMVEKLIKRVKKNKINLLIDPSVKGKLVNEGYSKAFGARPLRRLVTKYLEDTLSTTLLTSRIGDNSKQGCTIRISLNENDIITGQLIS